MKQIHRQRLLALARQVESKKPLRRKLGRRFYSIGFALETWFRQDMAAANQNTCGAAACLAGEAVMLFGTKEQRDSACSKYFFPVTVAGDLLGLDTYECTELFTPDLGIGRRDINITAARAKITGKQAARVVRHYVKTGNVDWSVRGEP